MFCEQTNDDNIPFVMRYNNNNSTKKKIISKWIAKEYENGKIGLFNREFYN